ncbi:hypothetical protein [Sulfitobacter mediterraneus]|uniref:Cation/multidrug efflux pump n=1 Tax=Sulfitobacter mediterraneus TaxID=83219 RepID=A0A061SRP3_9RHOB|nr:hypothetical protein [Sulfitobacter mediterraneus]KAJ04371.1 hypothetical protein PM02_02690 [Sulfitobacter mediterraneus]
MFALARLVVVGFIVLTVIYVCLSFYSRAVRKGKLRQKWQVGPQKVDRETFVQRGLEKYDGSIRRKLILGVYVVPVVVVGVIIYLTNFS